MPKPTATLPVQQNAASLTLESLVRAVALCGAGLDTFAARRLCEREGISYDEAIAAAVACGQLETVGSIVRHVDQVVCANVASSIGEYEAIRLHRQLAEAIADTALDAVGGSRARARHLLAAGDRADALALLQQAASLLEVDGDHVGAVECLDEAIKVTESDELIAKLLLRRAHAATTAGIGRAATCWDEVADACERLGDRDGHARALFHRYWCAGGEADAVRWLRAAARLGSGEIGWATRASALIEILGGRYRGAVAIDMQALRMARQAGDQQLEAMALNGVSACHSLLGDVSAAIRTQRQSIAIALSIGDHRTVVTGRLNLIMSLLDELHTVDALREAGELVAYVEQHNLGAWKSMARVQQADVLYSCGRLPEAKRITAAAWAGASRRADDVTNSYLASMHARVLFDDGTDTGFAEALELAEACGRNFGMAGVLQEAALLRVRQTALADIERALDLVAQLRLDNDVPYTTMVVLWLARLAAAHARVDVARIAYRHAAMLRSVTGAATALVVREVDATLEALEGGDATALIEVAEAWRRGGRTLDATRTLISAGCAQLAASNGPAAQASLMRAHRELVDLGSLCDLDLVSRRLRDLAGNDDDAPRHISESALLAGLGERELAQVESLVATSRYESGKVFYTPDVEHGTAYLLRSGRVRLYCMTDDGKRLTVEMLDPGAVFGENAVIGRQTAGLHAEADEPVVVGVIQAERMRELIRLVPRIGLNLLELVGERLQRSHELAEQVAFWTVNQRIARRLLELDERYGHPTLSGGRVINRVFTHHDLAEMVNARRETVGEFLKELRAKGIIETRKRRIVINDPEALRALSHG